MSQFKTILGIETSCDETSSAVLQKEGEEIKLLSNIISSSADLQAKYGGIIPEQAAREQLKAIIPVITESLEKAGKKMEDIEAIAVTFGPGLIGSLLIGVETAKVLALTHNKPLIPVNHLIGHFYANWIQHPTPRKTPNFPAIGLLVSGGHSDLVLFKNHGEYEYLGGTRDDAAGECFDKSARLLGYSYPGGPKISQFAQKGDSNKIKMPIPMSESKDYDFSFSGLKTHFLNLVEKNFDMTNFDSQNANLRWNRISADQLEEKDQLVADLCASLEKTIIKSLTNKTLKAMKQFGVTELIVAGGVAANKKLKETLEQELEKEIPNGKLFIPDTSLCMDNAAMIASAAFFLKPVTNITDIQANPNLSL
jgi:N6-L-threonylcarbamoyladenine synthase